MGGAQCRPPPATHVAGSQTAAASCEAGATPQQASGVGSTPLPCPPCQSRLSPRCALQLTLLIRHTPARRASDTGRGTTRCVTAPIMVVQPASVGATCAPHHHGRKGVGKVQGCRRPVRAANATHTVATACERTIVAAVRMCCCARDTCYQQQCAAATHIVTPFRGIPLTELSECAAVV
jgi:hypothetical protein